MSERSGKLIERLGPSVRRKTAIAAAEVAIDGLPSGDVSDGFDRDNAFMVYCSFSGDVSKTGIALNIRPEQVAKMAVDGEWLDKLAAIIKLKKAGKPGDLERGLNRTMNFVQAARTRIFLGRMLKKLSMMSDEELDQYCFAEIRTRQKDGTETVEYKLNTRPFADLCAAMEKCHQMSYMALNDSMAERAKKKESEDDGDVSAGQVHAAIAEAMSQVRADNSPRAQLFDEQLRQGNEIARQAELQRQLAEETKA